MPPIAQHNWILKLGVVLFLAGQTISIAHASEFGSLPHEHNDVACIAVLTDVQEGLVPTANLTAPMFVAAASAATQSARQAPLKRLRLIRPPPTGPPSI